MSTISKVLITGAAGKVAQGIIRKLSNKYSLKLFDLKKPEQFPMYEWVEGSILNKKLLEQAVEDVQAVVHCAVIKKSTEVEVSTEQFFDINVKGFYLLLEMCISMNVKKIVHVSSTAPVIGHWYEGQQITVESSYTTRGRYSLSKMLQERICEHIARNSPISIIALRPWRPCIGLSKKKESGLEGRRAYSPGLIDVDDFGEACYMALKKQIDGFKVYHTVATREAQERFDSALTEKELGFKAKQDFSSL